MKSFFIKSIYLSLYLIVMVISLWSSVSYFSITHPHDIMCWTLATAFEIGQTGCLISIILGDKNTRGLSYVMICVLTMFQAMANTYYAYISMTDDYIKWCDLFWLGDLETIDKKRILAFISGAILPLVALGFVHLFVNLRLESKDDRDKVHEEDSNGVVGDGTPSELSPKPNFGEVGGNEDRKAEEHSEDGDEVVDGKESQSGVVAEESVTDVETENESENVTEETADTVEGETENGGEGETTTEEKSDIAENTTVTDTENPIEDYLYTKDGDNIIPKTAGKKKGFRKTVTTTVPGKSQITKRY